MALFNSIGLRKLKMVACLMLLLVALAFILPAALAFILPKLRTLSMPSIRLFLLVNLMIFILLLSGGYFDRKPEEQQKALVCAPIPAANNPERTIVLAADVAAGPSPPAAVPSLTIDSKALVVSEPIDDSSLAQALVPVKAYYSNEELVSCKSLVPVPASPSSSSPRRRKVVKKKKKLPAEEIKVEIDPNNMIIVSTPPDLPDQPAKLSVQNLEACSLDEFNRFCDSFVHVRRQEWRLSSRGG